MPKQPPRPQRSRCARGSQVLLSRRLASFLLNWVDSGLQMYRAFVLLTILALAAGPSASALCHAWCSTEGATNECRHEGSEQSPSLRGGDCCPTIEAGVPAVLAKGLLTKVPSLDAAQAVPGHAGLSSRQSADGRLGSEPRGPRPFDPAPLSTILRI